jgi:branched-chain amino acid transport system substrate-binding protein
LTAALAVAGCGNSKKAATTSAAAAPSNAIKVAILSDCQGAFGAFYQADIGGAQSYLIAHNGAKANSSKPTDGITGGTLGGRPVQIVGYGCSNDNADRALSEARRLVEQNHADILIGPLSGDEGIAIANYSKTQPGKTFLNGTSGAQDTTLKVRSPNFFRFNSDGAQWSAGLGDYAYHKLGWRTAATIGDDYSFPYTSLAGFIAEFCAVGGKVTARVWPPLNNTDYSSYIAQIPKNVDGIVSGVGGSGLIAFVKQYQQQRGKLNAAKRLEGNVFVNDPLVLGAIGSSLIGAVAAGPTAGDSTTPQAKAYVADLQKSYPSLVPLAASVFTYNYYNQMWALSKALDQVHGDLSNNQSALQAALAKTTLPDAAYGPITLDPNRQAITTNYVQQVVPPAAGQKAPGVKTIERIPNVGQSFGGFFTPTTPTVDRTHPVCVKKKPPPWVGHATAVHYGP